ncbi:MAG: 50S ribosomal protein L32 [bacterium]|nr:50S ribosomal protein L32 [bacterium]
MALPKRKISKARRDKRRTHWKVSLPQQSICPKCHLVKLPHFVCPHCGYYKGKEVIKIKEKKE